jgi:hypothetical protein
MSMTNRYFTSPLTKRLLRPVDLLDGDDLDVADDNPRYADEAKN